jgi:hypothetical protein
MDGREQRIREVAHRLWEQEGWPADQDKRHWEMAERMVDTEGQAGASVDSGQKAQQTRPRRPRGTASPKRKKTPRA